MKNAIYVKQWLNRERLYTNRFAGQVYTALIKQTTRAAKEYKQTSEYTLDVTPLLNVYKKLYRYVSEQEAEVTMTSLFGKKDMISEILNFFRLADTPVTMKLVRDLMNQYFDNHVMLRLIAVNENTRKSIQSIIKSGVDRGLTTAQIARLIIDESKEINKARAIRIARTESITAANRTQLLVHEASPFEYEKAWLRVVDDRTRDGHIEMNPQVYIDLMDLFKVNHSKNKAFDMMLMPGDPSASPGNVVNCRCTLLFRVKRDSNGRPIRK